MIIVNGLFLVIHKKKWLLGTPEEQATETK